MSGGSAVGIVPARWITKHKVSIAPAALIDTLSFTFLRSSNSIQKFKKSNKSILRNQCYRETDKITAADGWMNE